jgi:MFS family permease
MTEKDWRHNQVVVLTTVVLVFGSFTMVVAFVPYYLHDLGVTHIATNAAYSGMLISISPLLAALVGPWWGKLADRSGLKPMAQRAMIAFTISWLIFGLATHVVHLVIARVIGGVFGGFNALTIPLATLGCPPEKVGKTIGLVQSTRTASIALGPVVGGLLATWVGPRYTAFFASGLYLVAFVLFRYFYREFPESTAAKAEARRLNISELLTKRDLIPLFLILFLTSFMERGFGPIIPLMVLQLGAPPAEAASVAGLVFSGAALTATLSAWFAGRLSSRWAPALLLRYMAVASTLAAVPLAFSGSNLQLGAYRCLLGLMAGGIFTVAFLLGNEWVPPHSRATGMGVLTSAVLLGNALGPLVVGAVAAFGLRTALGVSVLGYGLLGWISWRHVQIQPDSAGPAGRHSPGGQGAPYEQSSVKVNRRCGRSGTLEP